MDPSPITNTVHYLTHCEYRWIYKDASSSLRPLGIEPITIPLGIKHPLHFTVLHHGQPTPNIQTAWALFQLLHFVLFWTCVLWFSCPASVRPVCAEGPPPTLLHPKEPLPVPGVVHCHFLLLWVPDVLPHHAQHPVSWDAGMSHKGLLLWESLFGMLYFSYGL